MRNLILCLVALLALAACGGAEPKWASDADVARATYVHDGPPSVTLYTVTNVRHGSGAHSGLLINGAQRFIFDPAGTWRHPVLPERNDVHFGMTPKMVSFYIDYHARETYDVHEQTVVVSPQIAALVAQRALAYGAVPKAQCSRSISAILAGVPGFEAIQSTWYPVELMDAFATIPGVTTRKITDDDDDENHGVLLVQAGDPRLE